MFAKIVRVVIMLVLFYAAGMATFNFINLHELAGMAGSDIGFLKGGVIYTEARLNQLEKATSVSHQAIKAIVIKVSDQDSELAVLNQRNLDLESTVDKINAKLNEVIYHRTWEIKKKILENRTNLIRQGIWKE